MYTIIVNLEAFCVPKTSKWFGKNLTRSLLNFYVFYQQ